MRTTIYGSQQIFFWFNFIIRDRLVFSWKAPTSRHMLQPRLSLNPMVYMKFCSNNTMNPHPIYCEDTFLPEMSQSNAWVAVYIMYIHTLATAAMLPHPTSPARKCRTCNHEKCLMHHAVMSEDKRYKSLVNVNKEKVYELEVCDITHVDMASHWRWCVTQVSVCG